MAIKDTEKADAILRVKVWKCQVGIFHCLPQAVGWMAGVVPCDLLENGALCLSQGGDSDDWLMVFRFVSSLLHHLFHGSLTPALH